MKYYELTKEEQKILNSFDKGDFKSLNPAEKKSYVSYAKNSLKKSQNINIRLSESDLLKIKARALQKGIPYQTLIASVLHQYGSKG